MDLQESMGTTGKIAELPGYDSSFGVLIDVRELDYSDDASTVMALNQNLLSYRDQFGYRVAVVVADDRPTLTAELGAALAEAAGIPMRVFTSLDEARAWATPPKS